MKARVGTYVLLGLYAVVSLYPFAWMVSGAFKTNRDVFADAGLVPDSPTLDTFGRTWTELDFPSYFLNSLIVTGATVLGVLVVYSLAAYAFGVLHFPGRKVIYGGFISLLFVPGITVLLPVVILQQELGILGTHLGIVLPFVNGTAPLSILLLTNAFRSVPAELRESARCDGAGELRTFLSIYLPVSQARADHHRAADGRADVERVRAVAGVAERPFDVHAATRSAEPDGHDVAASTT